MALLIQKIQDKVDNRLVAPKGWITIDELGMEDGEQQNINLTEFELTAAHYLPLAAEKAQKLITALQNKLSIKVNISYLTIDNSTTFHVTMLVNMASYLSPDMQAARILATNNRKETKGFDMHYTFAAGMERQAISNTTPHNYKFKKIDSDIV